MSYTYIVNISLLNGCKYIRSVGIQFVLRFYNSFPRIAICPPNNTNHSLGMQFVPSIYNLFSRIALFQFVAIRHNLCKSKKRITNA